MKEGAESTVLPCKTTVYFEEDATVEWTRYEPEFMIVHVYQNGSNRDHEQDKFYCERTRMNKEQVKSGDLSLTLRNPTERDSGVYICTIYGKSDIVIQKVFLQLVKGQCCRCTSSVFSQVGYPFLIDFTLLNG